MKIEKFMEQQKELFDQFEGTEEKKKSLRGVTREERFSFSVSFDTLLLGGILLLMVSVLIYSTGVEIGRHHQKMLPVNPQGVSLQSVAPPPVTVVLPASKPASQSVAKTVEKPTVKVVPKTEKGGGVTIQVLSYRQSQPAEQALSVLRKKGYAAFLLTTPQGVVVCVGNFAKSSEAQPTLKELKALYPDCFVRKK